MIKMVTNMNRKSTKLLNVVSFLIIRLCRTLSLEPLEPGPEPHRVTAPAPSK
jgi:hypothetical protein